MLVSSIISGCSDTINQPGCQFFSRFTLTIQRRKYKLKHKYIRRYLRVNWGNERTRASINANKGNRSFFVCLHLAFACKNLRRKRECVFHAYVFVLADVATVLASLCVCLYLMQTGVKCQMLVSLLHRSVWTLHKSKEVKNSNYSSCRASTACGEINRIWSSNKAKARNR